MNRRSSCPCSGNNWQTVMHARLRPPLFSGVEGDLNRGSFKGWQTSYPQDRSWLNGRSSSSSADGRRWELREVQHPQNLYFNKARRNGRWGPRSRFYSELSSGAPWRHGGTNMAPASASRRLSDTLETSDTLAVSPKPGFRMHHAVLFMYGHLLKMMKIMRS